MAIFDHTHPKIIESTFSLHEFTPACKNHFILSVHFWGLWPDWPHPFLTIHSPPPLPPPKKNWSAFNFCDHVSTYKKSVYLFHLFILQIQLILASHHQTGYTHFWPWPHPFLCEIKPTCKKNQFIPSVLS